MIIFFETIVAMLLPIKSPVTSSNFWIALFEIVFIAFVVDFLALSRSFWLYVLLKFLPILLENDKMPQPFSYIWSLGSIE